MEKLTENVSYLYEEMPQDIKRFKKESYEERFEQFRRRNSVFFNEAARLLEEASEAERGRRMEEIARTVTDCASALVDGAGGKIAKENMQLNLNMVTVLYVIPSFLALDSGCMDAFADVLCREWERTFRGNRIQASDFAGIQAGFKNKLCYVTTAVCQSLHKPDDCYELRLLKNYRDEYLSATPEGAKLVKEYYNIAPTIVKRIDKTPDAGERYRRIWEKYLLPCIRLIEVHKEEACRDLYSEMVRELHQEYMEG